jgi:hypothetical protein
MATIEDEIFLRNQGGEPTSPERSPLVLDSMPLAAPETGSGSAPQLDSNHLSMRPDA